MPSDPYTNPFTLPGTQIQTMTNDAQKLSARTHRQSAETENPSELWYYRAGGWALFPLQPFTGPDKGLKLTQSYQQPATLAFTLPDPFGNYQTENLESPYNYDSSGNADALVDDARKIVLRVGTYCYSNLAAGITPTSTLATAGGSSAALSDLTDGTGGDSGAGPSFYCHFNAPSAAPFTLTVDLGSAKYLRHAVIQLASLVGSCSLPSSVQFSYSADNVTYTAFPVRPCGGAGSAGVIPGDWGESIPGQDIELAFCDLQVTGRYVRFTITPTGAQTIWISEIAVYGGSQHSTLGLNLFTGYMGDLIDFNNAGQVDCVAVDVLKRLADNNGNFLTAAYRLTGSGGVELGDIVHSLLTSTAYWKSLSDPLITDYDHPFTNAEIGWASGSGLTGLQYPLWQGQTNNQLGYCMELFAVVGWHFYADGNGTVQAVEPPYTQRVPDRVCIAGNDGNSDVSGCVRHRTGKQMRNHVVVQTGAVTGVGSAVVTKFDPNSTRRYGSRETRITDPLAQTNDLREKVSDFFLRDYSNNFQTLTNTIRPTFDIQLKQIFGHRAPARPTLYARSCSVVGTRRKRELWSLMSLTHNITYGKWTADAEYINYVPSIGTVPNFTALNIVGGHTDQLTVVFDAITDPTVVLVKAYVSTTDEFHNFAIYATALPGTGTMLLTGLTPAVPYWVYLTSVDDEGMDSIPSSILTAIPGSQSQTITCYTVTDFTCDSVLTSGPDAQGFYTYQFLALWNAPACGMTEMFIRANLDSLPVDDSHWLIGDSSWHWWAPDRILQNKSWDNVTTAQLDFVVTMRTTSNLSGHTMYFAIWNSTATRTQNLLRGNVDTTVVL